MGLQAVAGETLSQVVSDSGIGTGLAGVASASSAFKIADAQNPNLYVMDAQVTEIRNEN